MLITREMDYALRILRALHQGGQLSAAAVAQREHMPKAITLKLLNRLLSVGIVESRRGVNGGYFLKRSCEELKIFDLLQALGDPPLVNRCQREGYSCENYPKGGCGVCRELCRIQDILNQELQRTPLSDIFQ
ncbi:MAG: Rrf2 family transcriptional regulator [Oscillibacter sp.]|nr:Rrf2 family transcriptional regulator [Oscillibacter sp.]